MPSVSLRSCEIRFIVLIALLLHACHKDKRKKPSNDDTSPTHDTGPAPDTDPECDTGYLDDDGECVSAACGTGTWGNLELDESTVYVDVAAAEGGDGSEAAPFTSIQAGLDAAGDADGGMVAVAAGTYPETLELGYGHDGVHLAGRCRELVIIDASVGEEGTPGIEADPKSSEVEVSGVTVSGSRYVGLLVGSETVTIRESTVAESEWIGVGAYQAAIHATTLTMEACEVRGNATGGVFALDSNTSVTLRETTIEDTQPDKNGEGGYGIQIHGGASLDAEACEIRGNTAVGVTLAESGTSVTLQGTTIEDTLPDENGEGGAGIQVSDGASLQAEGCGIKGNTTLGVLAYDSDTSVTLRETTIEGTLPDDNEVGGYGFQVHGGASLDAESCQVRGNTAVGVAVKDSGTSVTLRGTTIEDNQPGEDGAFGYGIGVQDGASLHAEACEVGGNTAVGVLATDTGTSVTLGDTRIASTMRGEEYTVGIGVAAQESASVVATGIDVSSNEGVGLYVFNDHTSLSCSSCTILDNQFAGAVVVRDGTLDISDSFIEDTNEQENLGGGVGIYAVPWIGGPPTLSLTDTTIQDNAIAGVWLSGEGSYALSGNTIHGGEGWTRESLTKCGDAVYAQDGVTAWDGTSGLLLENNELLDGLGAGVFLDDATAMLSGNSYSNNAVDLVHQGTDCSSPPDGHDGEAFSSDVELCPTYDYATCGDEFALYLTLADPETGHGEAFFGPELSGSCALHLAALPVALPVTFKPPPLLPPAPHIELLEFRPQPLRFERAPSKLVLRQNPIHDDQARGSAIIVPTAENPAVGAGCVRQGTDPRGRP